MAKKTTTSSPSTAAASIPASTTPVRNSAIPPRPMGQQQQPSRRSSPSPDQIAKRAYEIWQSGKGGSQEENWYRAERELRGY